MPRKVIVRPDTETPDIKFHLTVKQLGELYRHLETKSYVAAAQQMKMDKWYAKNSMVPTVQKIIGMVRMNPEKYGVDLETKSRVETAIRSRNVAGAAIEAKDDREAAIDNQSFKSLLEDTRGAALSLLSRKMKRISRSTKRLDETNLATLTTSLAILIDKTQLIRGEATENVAVLAKIDQNITPEAALDMILKMRESNLEGKNNKK